MLKLPEIGYILPEEYLRAPESDCLLGAFLPCLSSQLHQLSVEPKASAYFEFLSGYLNRREWLTALRQANNFNLEDSRKVCTKMKQGMGHAHSSYAIKIGVSKGFLKKYRKNNLIKFKSAIKRALRKEEHCVHAQYYFARQEFAKAIKEAQAARLEKGDPRLEKNTGIICLAYAKIRNHKLSRKRLTG